MLSGEKSTLSVQDGDIAVPHLSRPSPQVPRLECHKSCDIKLFISTELMSLLRWDVSLHVML